MLELSDYSKAEKARILYNHIYFSELPEIYRKVLVDGKFYQTVLNHRNFNPRLIEWLSSYRRVKPIAEAYQQFVRGVLDNPQEIWRAAFYNQISDSGRSLLIFLFTTGGNARIDICKSGWKRLYTCQARKYNFQVSTEGFSVALKELEGAFISINKFQIEFLNPSIKDFIAALIVSSEDYTYDIVVASIYFDQILRTWQVSQQPHCEQLRRNLIAAKADLLDAMARCLTYPFVERIESRSGWAERSLDLYPEARLRGVIIMADDLNSETAWALTSRCLAEVLTRWEEASPDFEESVGILNALEGASWERIKNETELRNLFRAKLLDELQDAAQCTDFMFVEEYAKETQEKFTDEENEKFSKGFNNYINKWLPQEIRDFSANVDQLEEIAEFLSKMSKDYGYNIQGSYGRIMEVITELEDQLEDREQQRAEAFFQASSGEWKDRRAFERADEDAIDSMFRSLI